MSKILCFVVIKNVLRYVSSIFCSKKFLDPSPQRKQAKFLQWAEKALQADICLYTSIKCLGLFYYYSSFLHHSSEQCPIKLIIMNNKFSQENAFFKTTQNWLKTLQTKAKRFFIGNMEILALYRPRILKYNFIPEINYAYLVLQKNPNFHLKTPFFKTTQNWLITLQTKAKRFFIEKKWKFQPCIPSVFQNTIIGQYPLFQKIP